MKTVLNAAIAAIGLAIIIGCEDGSTEKAAVSGEFSLLTYNVAGLPTQIHESTFPEIYNALISPGLNNYDIVLVQEDFFYHKDLISELNHKYISKHYNEIYYNESAGDFGNLGDGLNIFSNYEFTTPVRSYWGTCWGGVNYGAADCLTPKGFFLTRVTLADGAGIDVYDLHHEAGSGPEDRLYSEMQVTTLTRFININSAGRTVIVAGDFNLNGSPELTTEEELEGTDEKQLRRYFTEAGMTDVCRSLECPEERIDRVLYKNGGDVELTPLEWSNESAGFQYTGDDPELLEWGTDLSDHQPVSAVFSWRKK